MRLVSQIDAALTDLYTENREMLSILLILLNPFKNNGLDLIICILQGQPLFERSTSKAKNHESDGLVHQHAKIHPQAAV